MGTVPHIFLPQNLEAFFPVMKGEEYHWYLGMDEATIEDLAFGIRPSREGDEVGRSRCLSTRQENDNSHISNRGYPGYLISAGAEFRDRRQGRMENGVKNLNGSEAIPKYISYHRKKDAYLKLFAFSAVV